MNTDDAWKQWGKNDPYYGVLSDKRFRKSHLDDNRQEFMASGVRHWSFIRSTCTTLYGKMLDGRCVDFGCGVARVLAPMSQDFQASLGIDVSPDMIAEASKNAPRSEFILSDSDLSKLKGTFDFVHSHIVLQHIPPEKGMHFIQLLLLGLNAGGIAALHVTLKRNGNFIKHLVYFVKHRIPAARFILNFLQGKALTEPVMQMNEYDLQDLVRIFESCKMTDIYIKPSPADDTFGVIMLAQKSAAT